MPDIPTIPGRIACRILRAVLAEHEQELRRKAQGGSAEKRDGRLKVAAIVQRHREHVEHLMRDEVRGLAEVDADVAALLCAWALGDAEAPKQARALLAEVQIEVAPADSPAGVLERLVRREGV